MAERACSHTQAAHWLEALTSGTVELVRIHPGTLTSQAKTPYLSLRMGAITPSKRLPFRVVVMPASLTPGPETSRLPSVNYTTMTISTSRWQRLAHDVRD